MRTLGKILLALLASLGFFTLILFVGILYALFQIEGARTPALPVAGKMVLSIDLDDPFIEGKSGPRIEGFSIDTATSLQDAVIAIRRAKTDARVVALKATLNNHSLGLAQIQEIRDSIADFRSGGKKAYLFSETMGEGEGTLPTYYLAAAFGDIWVQPSGSVGIAGIGTDAFFLKKFLERFGVKASFLARGEYKSAPETLTNTAMSPANREETKALIGSWFEQMLAGVAENRGLSVDQVKALVDKGPLLATEALEAKLVDHLAYRDEFDDMLKRDTSNATNVGLRRYLGMPKPAGSPTSSKRIALIHAVGEITRGEEDGGGLGGSSGVHSDDMVKAIRKAADDKDIAALLIRVDSPGGSYVASDTIWREVVKAKAKNKPVIISMGDTAASGGYFIAMPADRIFASPATVTGSIGVFTGKIVIGDTLAKLDINHERIVFGDSAGTYSAITDFSDKDKERINRMLDATYADFTGKAAQGRGKTKEEIEQVARGRVWSGTDALKVGLVDELGGFYTAIEYIKGKIGVKPEESVELVHFPESDEPWVKLFKAFDDGEVPLSIMNMMRVMAWVERVAGPVLGELNAIKANAPQVRMAPP